MKIDYTYCSVREGGAAWTLALDCLADVPAGAAARYSSSVCWRSVEHGGLRTSTLNYVVEKYLT